MNDFAFPSTGDCGWHSCVVGWLYFVAWGWFAELRDEVRASRELGVPARPWLRQKRKDEKEEA